MIRFSGLAAGFCLHLPLFSAGNVMFSEGAGCSYTVPCCYLHCTINRSKITDCPNAPTSLLPQDSHVSSPRWFTQQAYVIAPYHLPIAQDLLLTQVGLSVLQIWDSLVQIACISILTAHHYQAAALTLGTFFSVSFVFALVTSFALVRVMDYSLTLPSTSFLLRCTSCFDTFYLFYLKKTLNNSA